jgi:hypothetical protein
MVLDHEIGKVSGTDILAIKSTPKEGPISEKATLLIFSSHFFTSVGQNSP